MDSQVLNLNEFRDALGRFASGVTVITALDDGKPHGGTANGFVAISLDPPLVLVSLNNQSRIHRVLSCAGRYGVSVLAENQKTLSDHFAGPTTDDVSVCFVSRAGMPLLDGAVAYFVVRVIDVQLVGDHALYIGDVEHFEFRHDKPLLFYAGRYQQLRVEE